MARVYNGFSSYRLFAGGYQAAAALYVGLAEAVRRRLERPCLNYLRVSDDRRSRQRDSRHLPGSLFDARYEGLSARRQPRCSRLPPGAGRRLRGGAILTCCRPQSIVGRCGVPEDP
jgi:hypothetical protein